MEPKVSHESMPGAGFSQKRAPEPKVFSQKDMPPDRRFLTKACPRAESVLTRRHASRPKVSHKSVSPSRECSHKKACL